MIGLVRTGLVVGLLALAFSAVASGAEWRKASVRSAEGIAVQVDYKVEYYNYSSNKPYEGYNLSPVIINVSGGSLKASDRVRAVIVNKMWNAGSCGGRAYDWAEVAHIDLVPAPEGHFYGNLTADGRRKSRFSEDFSEQVISLMLVSNPYCQLQYSHGQEISVVVNGYWLVDPVTGATHFKLNLGEEILRSYRR